MSNREDNSLVFEGVVEEIINSTYYSVKLDVNQKVIKATVSGKMRVNKIRVLPGDRVTVSFSIYDLTLGRIIFRKKENQ